MAASWLRGLCFGLLLSSHLAAQAAEFVAPFVVTPARDVERMMALAEVGPGDYLIDLGSGDGRIVIAAAERGAVAHGIELDPNLVRESWLRAEGAGVRDRVGFLVQDLFEADLAGATVVTAYLMPDVMLRLRATLFEQLAAGTRIVSNSFAMGDWEPDRHIAAAVSGGLYLWVVPAKVAGDWTLTIDGASERMRLGVEQHFHDVALELEAPDLGLLIEDLRLKGDRIDFRAVHRRGSFRFSGRVTSDRMAGYVHVHDGETVRVAGWEARRD